MAQPIDYPIVVLAGWTITDIINAAVAAINPFWNF
jgi:hypothetical protein